MEENVYCLSASQARAGALVQRRKRIVMGAVTSLIDNFFYLLYYSSPVGMFYWELLASGILKNHRFWEWSFLENIIFI